MVPFLMQIRNDGVTSLFFGDEGETRDSLTEKKTNMYFHIVSGGGGV